MIPFDTVQARFQFLGGLNLICSHKKKVRRLFLRAFSFSVANQYPTVTSDPSAHQHTHRSDPMFGQQVCPAVAYRDYGELREGQHSRMPTES
jgi:hypothetical protein